MQRFIFVGHNFNIFKDADGTVLIADKQIEQRNEATEVPKPKIVYEFFTYTKMAKGRDVSSNGIN